METDMLKALAQRFVEEHERLERLIGDLSEENQRLRASQSLRKVVVSLDDDSPVNREAKRVTLSPRPLDSEDDFDPESPRLAAESECTEKAGASAAAEAENTGGLLTPRWTQAESAGGTPSPRYGSALRSNSMGFHTMSSGLPQSLPQVWPEWKAAKAEVEEEHLHFLTEKPRSDVFTDGPEKAKSGGRLLSKSNWARNFVLHPGSTKRTVWDILSMLIIGYDLVFVPFDLGGFTLSIMNADQVFGVVDICTSLFWLGDIAISFLTGFFSAGLVEMRMDRIAKRYIKGWFMFDLVVVLTDWIFIFIGGSTLLRLGKSKRLLRLIRTLRIVRSVKMTMKLAAFVDGLRSEGLRILFNTLALALFVLTLNHYFACGWFYVGSSSDPTSNWVLKHVENEPVGMQYVTSLHWSFTQFTPAGMEIHPNNFAERLYTCVTVFFAMITFSSFMGSITANMNALRKLTSEPAKQHKVLHEYFTENCVSAELGTRIWGYLKKYHFENRMCALKKDIAVFKFLPHSMSVDLNEELYVPHLKHLPFFYNYGIYHFHGLRAVCDTVISESSMILGERVFQAGTRAETMYVVTVGCLRYEHRDLRLATSLHRHQWCSEPALWMKWYYCGTCEAETSAVVLSLCSKKFRAQMSENPRAMAYVRTYIQGFRALMQEPEANEAGIWKTDVWMQLSELKRISHEAIPDQDLTDSSECRTPWFRSSSSSPTNAGAEPRRSVSSPS